MKRFENAIVERSFNFSVRIVNCYKFLMKQNKDLKSLYNQLLKSGTSIGANVSESQAAASKIDFKHKLRISLKEAYESEYWLRLFSATKVLDAKESESLINDCVEIIKILTTIIKNSK